MVFGSPWGNPDIDQYEDLLDREYEEYMERADIEHDRAKIDEALRKAEEEAKRDQR